MIKVASYARISQDSTKEGWAVETQRQKIAALAELRGWTITASYEDPDVSASKPRGPKTNWAKMLEAAGTGLFEMVVAVDLDRLLRSTKDLNTLIDHGLKVVTVDGEIDLSSADGEFRATMLAGIARFEARRKGERTLRSNERRRAEGLPILSGKKPFGYSKTGEVVPEQAAAVRKAFADFLSDPPVSMRRIATDLNEAGYKTARGTAWSSYAVRYLLSNALYAGFIEYHATGALFPVKVAAEGEAQRFPPIVDEDVWRASRARLAENVGRTTKRGNQPKYLLSRIGRCGRCGAPMVAGQNERQVPNYRCRATPHVSRQRELVDAMVNEAVITRLSAPDASTLFERSERADELDREELRAERAALRVRQDELASLLMDPSVPITKTRQAIAGTQERIGEIDGLLVVTGSSPGVDVVAAGSAATSTAERRAAVEAAWWALDMDRRRQVVESIMTVTIDPIVPGHTRFDPSLIRIESRANVDG